MEPGPGMTDLEDATNCALTIFGKKSCICMTIYRFFSLFPVQYGRTMVYIALGILCDREII